MRHSWYSTDGLTDWIRNTSVKQKTIYTTVLTKLLGPVTLPELFLLEGWLNLVHSGWMQQVECGRNDCRLWRTYKDLSACEGNIKTQGREHQNTPFRQCCDLSSSFFSYRGKTMVNLRSLKSARQTVTHFVASPQTQCQNAASVDHKLWLYFMSRACRRCVTFQKR